MHGVRRERGQADGDVLGAIGAGRAVLHPLARVGDDGLTRRHVERAEELWRIVEATIAGRIRPTMALHDCRMLGICPTTRCAKRRATRQEAPKVLRP